MRVLSLCSGVGGLDLGLERAGMTVVGHCEIDPQARAVLARHWPDVPVHDDITTMEGDDWDGRADLVAGGTPCTDLSVAGRRAGLAGVESRLFWDFCRVADRSAARWVLWENVAGALSSHGGADFAAVLWGLTGCRPDVPADGWRSTGVCVGPRRTAVWRLLDARYFGVAQRRRRVFVVAGPGDRCGLEVLAEPESLPGNPRPGAPAGTGPAGASEGGADLHRRGEFVGSLTAMDGWERPDNAHAEAGWLVPVSPTLTARHGNALGQSEVDALVAYEPEAVLENLRGEVLLTPYSRALTTGGGKPGQGYPAVLVALPIDLRNATRDADDGGVGTSSVGLGEDGDPAFTVTGVQQAIAFHLTQTPITDDDGVTPALTAGNRDGCAMLGVAERWVGGAQQDEFVTPDGHVGTLAHASNHHTGHHQPKLITPGLAVRRLTPRECERLMGWPDDWTRWRADGTEVPDSHRYRMCGNGVVSSQTEWIGRRIIAREESPAGDHRSDQGATTG